MVRIVRIGVEFFVNLIYQKATILSRAQFDATRNLREIKIVK